MFKINIEMFYVFFYSVEVICFHREFSQWTEDACFGGATESPSQWCQGCKAHPKYWPGRTIKGYLHSKMRVLRWRKAVERMKESYLSFHHDILCSYRTNCLTFLHVTSHSLLECLKPRTSAFRGGQGQGICFALELEDQQRGNDWARFTRIHRISLWRFEIRFIQAFQDARRASLAGECVYGLPGSSHIEAPNKPQVKRKGYLDKWKRRWESWLRYKNGEECGKNMHEHSFWIILTCFELAFVDSSQLHDWMDWLLASSVFSSDLCKLDKCLTLIDLWLHHCIILYYHIHWCD